MGVDLNGTAGGSSRVTNDGWAMALSLAQEYGWEPHGTLPPLGIPGEEWDTGQYHACDGQTVAMEDAFQIASALERARSDPGLAAAVDREIEETRKILLEEFDAEAANSYVGVKSIVEFKVWLKQLAEFMRQGAFTID